MRPSEILAGHGLAMLAVVLGQEVLLVALGQLFLDVDYLRVLPGTLLMAHS